MPIGHPHMRIALDKGAFEPFHGHDWDAGYDLLTPDVVVVPAHGEAKVDFGVHFEIPHGWAGVLASKSGLNFEYHLDCPGGIIDSEFTGPVKCVINNRSAEPFVFERGSKVVQILIVPVMTPIFDVVPLEQFKKTERGASGFGSTGR